MIIKQNLLFCLLLFCAFPIGCWSQEFPVNGSVISAKSNDPIPYANILAIDVKNDSLISAFAQTNELGELIWNSRNTRAISAMRRRTNQGNSGLRVQAYRAFSTCKIRGTPRSLAPNAGLQRCIEWMAEAKPETSWTSSRTRRLPPSDSSNSDRKPR